jgi:hypothetical protein
LTGQSHDYKRHGTTTLFAALEVATGKIIATHSKRRRRVEFLDYRLTVSRPAPFREPQQKSGAFAILVDSSPGGQLPLSPAFAAVRAPPQIRQKAL